jgi:hypothetical protein
MHRIMGVSRVSPMFAVLRDIRIGTPIESSNRGAILVHPQWLLRSN